jgi:hypothetical protein
MNVVTTLNQLHKYGPCKPRWNTLLSRLRKVTPDDEPLPLSVILDSNGLYDAIWCLRAVPDVERDLRLYAARCVKRLDLSGTNASAARAIQMVERCAYGEVEEHEMIRAGFDAIEDVQEGPLSAATVSTLLAVQAATLRSASSAAHWTVVEIVRARNQVLHFASGGAGDLEPKAPCSSDLSQLFREMFCTDEPISIQETLE